MARGSEAGRALRAFAALALATCAGALALAAPALAVEAKQRQSITIAATAGQFRLEFAGKVSKELAFNAPSTDVEDALREIVCGGADCLVVDGGPGNASGRSPYRVEFGVALGTTELKCVAGSPPLSGGSGCAVTPTQTRVPLGPLGAFAEPKGLAVDQKSHDVYAIDGRNEKQNVTVAAAAGRFRLEFEGKVSKELDFNVNSNEMEDALQEKLCGGSHCFFINGGPGDGSGSNPYRIEFGGASTTTDVEELKCLAGSPPLSGGSGCSVTTTQDGVNGSVSRYHANGTPAEFTALGSNSIDGLEGPDLTPQKGLHFSVARLVQVAVDETSGETAGEIYVTQPEEAHKLDVFGADGEHLGELTEYEETPGNEATLKVLGEVCGVAVDAAGDVYVADSQNGIHKYDPAGAVVSNADNVANFTGVGFPCGLAAGRGPTAGALFAISLSEETLFKLDATSGAVDYEISEGNTTVSVDPTSGHVVAANVFQVREWDASGESSASAVGSIDAGSRVTGVAVDGTTGKGGTVYLAREGATHLDAYGPIVDLPLALAKAPTEIAATAVTLHGTISADGGPGAICHFDYLDESTYQAQLKAAEEPAGARTAREIADAAFAGAQSAPCEPAGPFTGAAVSEVSAKATGLGFETKYEFRIVGENPDGANPSAAESFETLGKPLVEGTIASQVTASSATLGATVNPRGQATTYRFEYGTDTTYGQSAPAEAVAIGSGATGIAVSQAIAGLAPDTTYHFRAVATSPIGTTLGPDTTFTTFLPATSALPDGRAWELVSPAVRMGNVYPAEPFKHDGGSCKSCVPGWNAEKAPMQASPDGNAVAYEGDPFSGGLAAEANSYVSRRADAGWGTAALSTPQLNAQVFKAFSPDLSKAIMLQVSPALSAEAPAGFADLYLREEGKGLTALITAEPPNRSPGPPDAKNALQIAYAGANAGSESTPAFSHVIFSANDALSGLNQGIAPAAPQVTADERNLYEWSEGELHLVSVLPGNEAAAPNAVFGSGKLAAAGDETPDFDHAISDDGSRIFWSSRPGGQLYVREGGTTTTEIPDPGKFLTATPDGSKVLLSDGVLYDLESESPTDLTGGAGGFQGIAGAAEDLSRIYFVDTEALTDSEEENANAEAAEEGAFNLYLWEAGTVSFIGRLGDTEGANDNSQGDTNQLGVWRAGPGSRLAQASADGRFLAFQSRARLTGYENLPRATETCSNNGTQGRQECPEVFEYDALTQTLSCASCNPSGERPLGGSTLSLINTFDFFPQPRNLPPQGEGRLFFESLDALTQNDTNGRIQDVYQFEPAGVGDCTRAKGCLSLISSGRGPKDSVFLDASASGEDVFFTTTDQLVPQDRNDFTDLYDARVGGGIAEVLSPPCAGQACRGAAGAPPSEQTAASATFAGPPNPRSKPCKKGFARKHGRCVKKHKHHKQKHKRLTHRNRGGSSR